MTKKKTYIPSKPRNKNLSAGATTVTGVGRTEFKQVAGSSHEHSNKGVLDQITEAMLVGALRDLITSTDVDAELTDENILSALRVLAEISKANADLLEDIKAKFLSKIEPDTAQGLITFLKGINVVGNADVSGKTTSYELLVQTLAQTHNLDVTNTATILNGILKGVLSSEEFNSGFLGSGFRLNKINDRWALELDDLIVRKTLQIFELIVQKIRYQGGQVLHSPAGGKITAITDGGSYWRCEHDSTDSFTTGAQVLCQNFKVGSEQQNPDGSTTLQGVSVKRYWRLVTSFGKGWFNLSKSDCEPGSSVPEVGDDVAVLGHRSDPDQQSAIMLVSAGTNSPYIAHYSGINSFSLAGKEVVRDGNLQGIVDPDFGQLSGYGLYSKNVYLKGVFRLLSGKTIEEVVSDLDGELSSVESYVQTEIEAIPGKIKMEVSKVEVGGKNLLRNYDGRFGMDYWSGGAEFVDEQGIAIPITVLSVTAPNPISVYTLDVPTTPETVKLWLDDGSSVNVPVVWGAIDTSVVGEFNIQGTYELPEGVTGDKPEVILKVVVSANTVVSVTPLSQVTVDQYRTPALPTTIELKLINGAYVSVPVTWGSYNTSQAGTFELTAVYDLPTGVSGYKPTVKVTLIVNAVADTGTFIDVIPYLTSIKESGTDDWGNWIIPNYQSFDSITSHMVAGQTRLYARYRNGSSSSAMVFYYKNATPSFQHSVTLPSNSNQAVGLSNFLTGVFEGAQWLRDTIKLYNLEIRNDGSVPPWYIV